jgi:membrane protease subunit (stomatin/prohibitin family)
MRDPTMAAASLVSAQGDAMRAAASNQGGAMMGFMGLGMAKQAGGMNPQALFQMGQAQGAKPASASGAAWVCSCGHAGNAGKFCAECGKPAPAANWTCSCGHAGNTGKFCEECGKPAPAANWTCSCGHAGNTGKFCAECGKPNA